MPTYLITLGDGENVEVECDACTVDGNNNLLLVEQDRVQAIEGEGGGRLQEAFAAGEWRRVRRKEGRTLA